MSIKIIAYGIAKDIIKNKSIILTIEEMTTIAKLKEQLILKLPKFDTLKKISFAVNESYVSDNYELQLNDEVVIIPPVSGG